MNDQADPFFADKPATQCCVFYNIEGHEGSVWWLPISDYENCIIDACDLIELGVKAWVATR